MATDTSVNPEKKLEGVELTRPDAAAGIDPAFAAAMEPDNGAALAGRVAALEDQLATTIAERDAAVARADKAEAATARAKAKVSRGEVPAKPRRLKADIERPEADALDAAIAEATAAGKTVEIAFSDGRGEVPGIPPVKVEGDVWKRHARGLMLRDPVKVQGPAVGEPSMQIRGYALLIDGKQIAYTERSEQLIIAGGQAFSLADDIYF